MPSPGARQPSGPVRTFGTPGPVTPIADQESPSSNEQNVARRILGRISFGSLNKMPSSLLSRRGDGEDAISSPGTTGRPPVPTVMQPSGETYTTPLPALSMIVLSITMLGEFLSANVSTPFLLFMVKGFGGMSDDSEVAFWTGILVSTFFLTQFLTSLLWATVAEKHGRRVVLVLSLSGSAVTCFIFGTSTTLQQAIVIRLAQGVFAGAVGVARGSVAFVTDSTNEGRAYAILGFCWGFGGVAGAIIGGSFEQPAIKWPDVFGEIQLFITYPYLLPCAIAALVMFIGSLLGLFLDRDGGPRQGAIRLPPEKIDIHPTIPEEESAPPSPTFEQPMSRPFVKRVQQTLSGYFASRVPHVQQSPSQVAQPAVPMGSPRPRSDRPRTFSRTSRVNGSAYGYGSNYRRSVTSNTTAMAARKSSLASSLRRRRGSGFDVETSGEGADLNFAQRLLMANENAVTNIADLWVAAAMNVDNEDPFETDEEEEGTDDSTDSLDLGEPLIGVNSEGITTPTGRGRRFSRSRVTHNVSPTRRSSHRPSHVGNSLHAASNFTSPQRRSTSRAFTNRHASISGLPRRLSSTVPSIFSHTGVKSPPAFLEAQRLVSTAIPAEEGLEFTGESTDVTLEADIEALEDKQPSLASQLPILVIVQYGMMALHTTTHDQIFMSYLVSDYDAGGLNLNAGHFAQLIALMCLCQIAYQFYLYPNLGPPRGRFSHLSMFRVGSLLFIPSYLSVVLYRVFASSSNDGNFVLMTALALSTALRYCGSTFGYTAISILLNYMTPPSAVGYANGIAQSIVSLARCIGPSLGGYIWAISVREDPNGFYLGFVACAAFCGLSVLQSFLIR
ncbi:major facilitator superfamily MFS-1 [Macrolepiota fuliginosa MF-IS2]|uniref:Major facilitator superfamily MFS-1 n=1 Tax=Macrolepiota fuliginosa MF-IS2 TaxID=1400762 RepID=A0A9P6C355_9AGAR|nr:major facilitator superfamily MFS-1 [Macrolepiota fuliginosa MF-IS2]